MHPVRLRLATVADAAAVHAIYAPIVRETPISFEWEPPAVDEIAGRIAHTLERWPWIVAVGASGDLGTATHPALPRPPHPDPLPRGRGRGNILAQDTAATAIPTKGAETAPDEVLGYAYATPYRARVAYRWSIEVSVYVARAVQRRGLGRRLYGSLFALLRAQNYHIAYAGVTVPNAASVALHEAVGFEPIGVFPDAGFKFGAWHDVLWMHRELAPAESDPPEPVPLGELDPVLIRDALG